MIENFKYDTSKRNSQPSITREQSVSPPGQVTSTVKYDHQMEAAPITHVCAHFRLLINKSDSFY